MCRRRSKIFVRNSEHSHTAIQLLTISPQNHSRSMNWSNTRLGMILGTNSACGPDGRLHMNHANGRLIEAISERTGGARICVPVLPQVNQNMTHVLPFQPEDIVKLPPLGSTMHAQRYFFAQDAFFESSPNRLTCCLSDFRFNCPGPY